MADLSSGRDKGSFASQLQFNTTMTGTRTPTGVSLQTGVSTSNTTATPAAMRASALGALSSTYKERAALLKEREDFLAAEGARIGASAALDTESHYDEMNTKAQQDAYLKIKGKLFAEKKAADIMAAAAEGGGGAEGQIEAVRKGLFNTDVADTPFIEGALPTLIGAVAAAKRVDAAAASKAATEAKAQTYSDFTDQMLREAYHAKTKKDKEAVIRSFINDTRYSGLKKNERDRLLYDAIVKNTLNSGTPEEFDDWEEVWHIKGSNGKELVDMLPGGYGALIAIESARESFMDKYNKDVKTNSSISATSAKVSLDTAIRTGAVDFNNVNMQEFLESNNFLGHGSDMTAEDRAAFINYATTLVESRKLTEDNRNEQALRKKQEALFNEWSRAIYEGDTSKAESLLDQYYKAEGSAAVIASANASWDRNVVGGIKDVLSCIDNDATFTTFIESKRTEGITPSRLRGDIINSLAYAPQDSEVAAILRSNDSRAIKEAMNNPDSPLRQAAEKAVKDSLGITTKGTMVDIMDSEKAPDYVRPELYDRIFLSDMSNISTAVGQHLHSSIQRSFNNNRTRSQAKEDIKAIIPKDLANRHRYIEKAYSVVDDFYNERLVEEKTSSVAVGIREDIVSNRLSRKSGGTRSYETRQIYEAGGNVVVKPLDPYFVYHLAENKFSSGLVIRDIDASGDTTRTVLSPLESMNYILTGATSRKAGYIGDDAMALYEMMNIHFPGGITGDAYPEYETGVNEGSITEEDPLYNLFRVIQNGAKRGIIDVSGDSWKPNTYSPIYSGRREVN